ncbi:MAG TPA: aminotransferase class I/II-fold pyridoxal phosphate-dependent enzyme, partial [Candidatus Nanopelagicales bacterium]|nr:aminotransferase class I/II-fold pyridoxal phosphate-dependent enzyme [Candidatus Nanopelagicales bacterium]
MTDPAPVSSRIRRAADTMTTLLRQLDAWDAARTAPDACDLMLGNPQDMPLTGLVEAIRLHAVPQHKDWFAYKRSEAEPRAVVARSLRDWRGLPFRPEDVFLTTGAFGALAVLFQALLDPGDEVVYSLPPWFLYEPMLVAAGAVPIKVRVREDDNDLDLDALAAAIGPATRAVIVNTPSNPTGRVHPPDTLAALASLLTEKSRRFGRPIWLISDESYSRLVYSDAQFHSPIGCYPYSVLVYTYGKVLLAPGQRIGYLALSPSLPGADAVRPAVDAAQIAAGWMFPNAVMQYAVADLDALAAAIGPATRAVIVNTPSNPTGRIHPPATLAALASLLTDASRRHGRPIWLISDEAYSRLVYSDAEFHSPIGFYPYSVLVYT